LIKVLSQAKLQFNLRSFQSTAHYIQATLASLTEVNKRSTTEPFVPAPDHNANSKHRSGWLLSKHGACKQFLLSALGSHI